MIQAKDAEAITPGPKALQAPTLRIRVPVAGHLKIRLAGWDSDDVWIYHMKPGETLEVAATHILEWDAAETLTSRDPRPVAFW